MRILAFSGKPFLFYESSLLTTKPISAATKFTLPEDYINIREIIKSLTLKHVHQLVSLRSIQRNAIAHALVVIGNTALLIYGNLTSPHYLRVPFEIQTAKGLSAAILFNPVINLTGKGYQEVRWNFTNYGITLFPYTEGKFIVYNQGRRRKKGEVVPPVDTRNQPSPLPEQVPLRNSTVKNLQSSVKRHAITAEDVANAELKMERAVIRETPGGVKIYNAFEIGGLGLNFDKMKFKDILHSVKTYCLGIKTFGDWKISSLLFSRLLVQLHAWPKNFILVVIPNIKPSGESIHHHFFFKNPQSDDENDIQYAVVSRPKTIESTIDLGIENPQYVRIVHNIDHYDSVVDGRVEIRFRDGNCYFYAVLGSMTPEMRKQFFANAGHEYNEDSYSDFKTLDDARQIDAEELMLLTMLKEKGKHDNMSDKDYDNAMMNYDNYVKLQGTKEDIMFLRQLMLEKFKKNSRQYIEFFGKAERPDNN